MLPNGVVTAGTPKLADVERPGVDAEATSGSILLLTSIGLGEAVEAERASRAARGRTASSSRPRPRSAAVVGSVTELNRSTGLVRRHDFAAVAGRRRLKAPAVEHALVDQVARVELVVDLDREGVHVGDGRAVDVLSAASDRSGRT